MGSINKLNNAGKPWTEEDIFLIGQLTPTKRNINYLSNHLGRTPHAVQYMYCKLYTKSGELKRLAESDTSKSQQYEKILKVRKSLGLNIGL